MKKLSVILTVALATASTSAFALPAPMPDSKRVLNGGTAVEKSAYRRCSSRAGRHCRAYRTFGYRAHSRWHTEDPSRMRTGSRRWWNAKDREGSTGRP
jgi:hypothetical protein